MIARDEYLDILKTWKDQKLIKVVTGIRRCGKSTLFLLYIDYLKTLGIKSDHILLINFENYEFNFSSYNELYEYLADKLKDKNKYYIFLDEVQNVPLFQKAVDALYIKDNVDLYITGSNAFLLSGELATLLSGRYIEIKMLPLSFKEYCVGYKDKSQNYDRLLLDYMDKGGMPGMVNLALSNITDTSLYLDGIISTVVYKDIMLRNGINDKILLENILRYIFDNIGSPISPKKISDTLTSKRIATSNHTVDNYINAFIESYLIYKVDRYDIKGKEILAREYKYYAVDTGLRRYFLGQKSNQNMGYILENIVYLELLRRGYKVYVGKFGDLEIDFVAENNDGVVYYQVSLSTKDEKVLERELKPLQKTIDHYPKYLLTMDMELEADYDGIKKINIVDWLLKK